MNRKSILVATTDIRPPSRTAQVVATSVSSDQDTQGLQRFRFPPPRQILRAASSALAAIRYLPIFTPRQTLARWRARRALRQAAREARDPTLDRRDWMQRFRLNGLTWHHLYISQDLRRIALFLREIQGRLDAPGDPMGAVAALMPLERSYAYLLDNVWDVYNTLERDVLFPWIRGGTRGNANLPKAMALIEKERLRIEDSADVLQSRFAKLVCATGRSHASLGDCANSRRFNATRIRRQKRKREKQDAKARAGALTPGASKSEEDNRSKKASLSLREGYIPTAETQGKEVLRRVGGDEVRQLALELGAIIEDTERLHKTERTLLYPIIANSFSEREQGRLTNVMVYSMRSVLAKFIITIYHQAVEKNASRAQWTYYRREVPLPIRAYTPIWRARLYDECPLGWLRQTSLKQAIN